MLPPEAVTGVTMVWTLVTVRGPFAATKVGKTVDV